MASPFFQKCKLFKAFFLFPLHFSYLLAMYFIPLIVERISLFHFFQQTLNKGTGNNDSFIQLDITYLSYILVLRALTGSMARIFILWA